MQKGKVTALTNHFPYRNKQKGKIMVPETAETTETKSTELSDEEKAAITAEIEKLEAQMGAGFEEHGVEFFRSDEALKIGKAIDRLKSGKKAKKVADPRKAEVKEALPAILETQAGRFRELLVAQLVEKFPYLAELESFTVDVKLKAKGIGRTDSGEGTTRSSLGRIIHRDSETMVRCKKDHHDSAIDVAGMPGFKKVVAAYPDQADEIAAIFGTAALRKELYESICNQESYTEIVHLKLDDGTCLCIQK